MFDILKFAGALFFTLFVFIYSNSAQEVLEKNNSREETQKRKTGVFGKEQNPFAPKLFEKEKKSSEKDLLSKKISKDEKDAAEQTDYKFRRGEKEWNIDFGYSPIPPTNFDGTSEYNITGRKLGLAAVRWGRIIGTAKGISWQYLIEAVPLTVSLKNEVANPYYISPSATPNEPATKRETSYGVGISPLAFRFYFLPKNRIKPFVQFGAGILYMNKPTPLPETSKFNFTGYFGGGFLIHTSRNRAISLSYRYFHISNANTQHLNPGYNANVFSIGYSFFYK
ncbi:MAG: acyloxyacyl hydrolase [Pyrinomonadaceae bacterium]